MEIKVLGTGCANCKALYVTVEQAVRDLNLDATLVKEEDISLDELKQLIEEVEQADKKH